MNRRASRILTVCAAVWLLVIWGHSCLPAAQSGAESGALLVVVQDLLPWMTDHVLRRQFIGLLHECHLVIHSGCLAFLGFQFRFQRGDTL